jgi:hypothetical protein
MRTFSGASEKKDRAVEEHASATAERKIPSGQRVRLRPPSDSTLAGVSAAEEAVGLRSLSLSLSAR